MHDRPTKFRTSDNRDRLSPHQHASNDASPRDLSSDHSFSLTLRPLCCHSPSSYAFMHRVTRSKEREGEREESLILTRRWSFPNEWRVPPHKSSVDKLEEPSVDLRGWMDGEARWIRTMTGRGKIHAIEGTFFFFWIFFFRTMGFIFRDFGLTPSRFIGYRFLALRSVWKILWISSPNFFLLVNRKHAMYTRFSIEFH